MLITTTLHPNNRITISETYPSNNNQKEKKPSGIDKLADYYHFNSPSSDSELDIDFDFQQPTEILPKSGYGTMPSLTSFTRRAKNKIFQTGGAIEKEDMPSIFLTGTLPANTQESFEALSCYSSYILNRLKTKFNQLAKKYDENVNWLSVWEYQKRGALHLHVCISSHNIDFLQSCLFLFKPYWIKLLAKVEQKSGVSMLSAPDGYIYSFDSIQAPAQVTKKSVSQYLAKYLSKGTCTDNSLSPPASWFSQSRNLKPLIEKHTTKVVENADTIYDSQGFKILLSQDCTTDIKEIKKKYSNRISLLAFIHPPSFDFLSVALERVQYNAVKDVSIPFSKVLQRGYDYLVNNFYDVYNNLSYLGFFLDGISDLSSFFLLCKGQCRLMAYAVSCYLSEPVFSSLLLAEYVEKNNLIDLLTSLSTRYTVLQDT